MSWISHINYTASVGSTPINVKNANRLHWMVKQTGNVSRFIFSYPPKKLRVVLFDLTMDNVIIVREKTFTDFGEIRVLCGEIGEQSPLERSAVFFSHLFFRHQRIGCIVITASVNWILFKLTDGAMLEHPNKNCIVLSASMIKSHMFGFWYSFGYATICWEI